jgi:hypothetical protein
VIDRIERATATADVTTSVVYEHLGKLTIEPL